jgi:hypothetical protein
MRATLAAACLMISASFAFAADATPLNDADCDAAWKQAGGRELTTDTAKPYVTSFEQVDVDKDGSIDYKEFKAGCKAGLVKKSG